jgi:hypothetical protein
MALLAVFCVAAVGGVVTLGSQSVAMALTLILPGLTIGSELREASFLHVSRADLRADASSLLACALAERVAGSLARVMLLVEAAHPERGLARARLAPMTAGSASRSRAIELIDTVGGWIHRVLVPMLDGEPGRILGVGPTQLGIESRSLEARLGQLAAGPDRGLQARTGHEAGRGGRSELSSFGSRAVRPHADLVRCGVAGAVHG